jgi:hypothetical protein
MKVAEDKNLEEQCTSGLFSSAQVVVLLEVLS